MSSDFEFQRLITVGQYLPTGSPVHRLDPRTRLLAGLFILAGLTVAPRAQGVGIVLLGLVGLLLLARVPLGYALRGLLPPLPFILLLALLQVLLNDLGTEVLLQVGPVAVTLGDLEFALLLLVRFAGLILIISLISFTISTPEIVRGLASLLHPLAVLGLPTHEFVLMVQVSLRFLPLLAQEAERIAKAQASRGAEWGTGRGGLLRRARRALPLIVPLFLTALRRAERLAEAMEARGYHGGQGRTSMVTLRWRAADTLALLVGAGLGAAALLL